VLSFSDAGLGALCATGSALTWAVTNLLIRSLSTAFNSVALNALRSTMGGALVVLWVATVGGWGDLATMSARAFWLLAISVVLALGVGDTVFFESTRWLGLAQAMTIAMTYPIFSALLAVAFLNEPLSVHVLVGSVVTLAGVALTVRAQGDGPHAKGHVRLGVAAALFASVVWAIAVVAMKPALEEVDAVRAQAIRLPLAAAMLWATPWAWRRSRPLTQHPPATLWLLVALGGLTAVSSITFVAGVQYAGVAVATVLSSTAPIFALPLGFLFLRERPGAAAVAGTLLSIIGVAVLQR